MYVACPAITFYQLENHHMPIQNSAASIYLFLLCYSFILYLVSIGTIHYDIRGLFAKFMDSRYYSELELHVGAVTVSFWSTSLGKQCTSYNVPPTS
jgi:hypothetical protein